MRTAPLLVLSSLVVAAAWSAEIPEYRAELRPVAPIENVRLIRKVVFSRRRPPTFFLLDREAHAVRLILPGGTRVIGEIGNAPGELYYPFDLAVGGDDRLYIKDGGNRRIQMIDADGRFLGAFPDQPKSEGIGVDRRGNIYLGQPANGRLISVYDGTGKKLKEFGNLLSPAALYPQLKTKENAYRTALNRVRIAIDDDDNVWVAFIHAPVVRKYERNGRLLAEQTLRLPGISSLVAAVPQTPAPPQYMSQNFDGIQLTMVIREIAFDRRSRRPLLLLGDDSIVYLGGDGAAERMIRPEGRGGSLETLAVDEEGAVFTSRFLTAQLLRVVLSKPQEEMKR